MATLEYVTALVTAATRVAIPNRTSTAARTALREIFGMKSCGGKNGMPPVAGSSPGSDPSANAVPDLPEQAACNNAKQRADNASKNDNDLAAKITEAAKSIELFSER